MWYPETFRNEASLPSFILLSTCLRCLQYHMASVADLRNIRIKNGWNESDRVKPKSLERKQSQCHYTHHKYHMDWRGIELRPLW
jgi:hypothetical protein